MVAVIAIYLATELLCPRPFRGRADQCEPGRGVAKRSGPHLSSEAVRGARLQVYLIAAYSFQGHFMRCSKLGRSVIKQPNCCGSFDGAGEDVDGNDGRCHACGQRWWKSKIPFWTGWELKHWRYLAVVASHMRMLASTPAASAKPRTWASYSPPPPHPTPHYRNLTTNLSRCSWNISKGKPRDSAAEP